ncbi:AI-2E family transporter [Glycomyces sp. TRM65418]|uniref:AI-2E family transporter n=1 Tax=Glycomyces sp. TRM65418 TaxID=2867006 RepID=UPI001CE5A173|nr:AI-2E family transporter [Glycomyces sp. TRM65418]MCC3763069.1 AI-2E family transporter [Glycomyces sp. TRM65418]QZD57081.1 AI-2E family transporter [Glycomyces sp. TRM65418]
MSEKPGSPARRSLANTPPLTAGVLFGAGLALVTAAVWAVQELGTVITALIVAAFLAVGLERIVSGMTKRGMPRWLAMTILFLGLVIVFCGGIAAIIPAIVRESAEFVENAPGYYDALMGSRLVERFGGESGLLQRAEGALTPGNLTTALGGVAGGVASFFGGLVWTITTLLLTLFILAAYNQLRRGMVRLFAASQREQSDRIIEGILRQIGSYLIGALAIGALAGISSWIFMAIAGIPYGALLALLVALLDLIPQIGATIGAVVVTLVALAVSPMTAVASAIFFIAYQQLENWVIYPTVMRSAVKVSNLAAIVAVLVGGTLFGVVGIVLSVPIYAAIRLIGKELVLPRLDNS